MAGFGPREIEQLRTLLQDATVKCSERCLYQSAKWAAELLLSLPPPPPPEPRLSSGRKDQAHSTQSVLPVVLTANDDPDEALLEAQEASRYLLAKSFFDCREYDRCAAVFMPENLPLGPLSAQQPSATPNTKKGKGRSSVPGSAGPSFGSWGTRKVQLSQKALFLSLYAKLMAGERRKDEESEMILGPTDGGKTVNRELPRISKHLRDWFTETPAREKVLDKSQGWLEYLYGIVLSKEKNDQDAKYWLMRSVNRFPFNWGAWQELNDLLTKVEEFNTMLPNLPTNLITYIFRLYVHQELYQSTEAVHSWVTELENVFPESQFLKTQRALLHYHSKDFDEAEAEFAALVRRDPYRIDYLDHYSNILYVMALRPKLAFLAQLATSTDRFRPETCCVVGNYYSLKSEHEKAVMYFRRALTLDRRFLSAWTLMGHEYVEMKNTHAAIESYRRAVDVNRKDYRAWYGLGQTYEMLEMHYYALFYYQRAASLRPYDPKMWQAVGSCFNKMDRPVEAIKALKRALLAGTYYDQNASFGSSATSGGSAGGIGIGATVSGVMDPETLFQIALMYEKLRELDEAAAFMDLTVAQEDGQGDDEGQGVGVTPTTSRARMWLAKWEFGRGELKRAMALATELCQDGVEVEEAKALVRDLRARMEQAQIAP
ncbi:MAG: hypothetical protein M1825_005823 [Sarcosagium campestre]|nr:MAG: hypothetical protein M1825_005823 [Sarcosagium campestre]